MKRGTASRVILGKNTIAEMPGGVFVGTDVILGKKDGLTNDFNGLVLSNTVMLGKKVSHAAIISVIVRGADRIVLPDAIADSLTYVKAFGGTEQNGTPTPDAPMDIVSNNGVLKYSANMANVNAQTVLVGYYISTSGVVTASTQNWIYQDYIPVEPNTTYTITMSSPIYFVSISEYSTANDSGFIVRDASGSGTHTQFTITTSANTHFVRFGANLDGSSSVTLESVLAINWMLNKGNSMPYMPYGIYTDGTVETINAHGTNLLDLANCIDGYYYTPAGEYAATPNARLSNYIPVKAGDTYTVGLTGTEGQSNVRINLFDTANNWLSQTKNAHKA